MPIYEYQCSACGQSHDALQKLSDAPLVDCPECGQPELKKKISAAGFRLTGGGWYETDFKTGDKKKNLSGDSQSSGADKLRPQTKHLNRKNPHLAKRNRPPRPIEKGISIHAHPLLWRTQRQAHR